MDFRDWIENGVFLRVALVLWIVSSVFVVYLVSQIDGVVNGSLYNFGLEYSFAWYTPYQAFLRLVYVCMAVPAVLSVVVLVGGLLAKGGGNGVRPFVRREEKTANGKVEASKGNNMVISCPKCKRVFSKPLSMLDFSGGKTRLVNVCPYCNHVLGGADEKGSSDDIRIVDLNKKEEVPQE